MSSRRRRILQGEDGKEMRLMTSEEKDEWRRGDSENNRGRNGHSDGSANEKLDALRGQRLGRSNGDGGNSDEW